VGSVFLSQLSDPWVEKLDLRRRTRFRNRKRIKYTLRIAETGATHSNPIFISMHTTTKTKQALKEGLLHFGGGARDRNRTGTDTPLIL
jgi:hypothetical protein